MDYGHKSYQDMTAEEQQVVDTFEPGGAVEYMEKLGQDLFEKKRSEPLLLAAWFCHHRAGLLVADRLGITLLLRKNTIKKPIAGATWPLVLIAILTSLHPPFFSCTLRLFDLLTVYFHAQTSYFCGLLNIVNELLIALHGYILPVLPNRQLDCNE